MFQTIIVGLDLSLTETGLSIHELNSDRTVRSHTESCFGTDAEQEDPDCRRFRFSELAEQIIWRLDRLIKRVHKDREIELVFAQEQYIMSGIGRGYTLAEMAGYVKARVSDGYLNNMGQEHLWFEVPATTLKNYATGNGRADKDWMAATAYERFKIDFKNDNECDAFWLADFGNMMTSPRTDLEFKAYWRERITIF